MINLDKIPASTEGLLEYLKEIYSDVMELDPTMVGTPEYWKKAGVIELIQKIEYYIENK
jgi:hypothetical protein